MANHSVNNDLLDPFLEFLEVFIHQIVYLRQIYPASIFTKKKKYKTPVMMSEHPMVNEYIEKTLSSIKEFLSSPDSEVESVILVVEENGRVVEKTNLEIDMRSIRKQVTDLDQYLIQLQLSFVSVLLKLSQIPSSKRTEAEGDRIWWIELCTTQGGAFRLANTLDWSLASSTSTPPSASGQILPVLALNHPVRLQVYLELFASGSAL